MFYKCLSVHRGGRAWQGACVVGGMHDGVCVCGRGCAWQRGACMARGYVWWGGMCVRRHAWQRGMHGGGCVWQGAWKAGGHVWHTHPLAYTTRYGQWVGGMHPTGMHSCLNMIPIQLRLEPNTNSFIYSLLEKEAKFSPRSIIRIREGVWASSFFHNTLLHPFSVPGDKPTAWFNHRVFIGITKKNNAHLQVVLIILTSYSPVGNWFNKYIWESTLEYR